MNTRFVSLANELKRLGKEMTEPEMVKKFLRSLTKDWEAKKTTIEEAHSLNSYSYDELIGNLLTQEMSLARYKEQDSKAEEKKKKIAPRVEQSRKDSVESEKGTSSRIKELESERDQLALVVKRFNKLFERDEKRRFRKYRPNRKHERSSGKGKSIIEDKKSPDSGCFECEEKGHFKAKSPKLKKSKKFRKKAMVATWSESDSEDELSSSTGSDEDEEEVAHCAFMAVEYPEESQSGEKSQPQETEKIQESEAESSSSEVSSKITIPSNLELANALNIVMKIVRKNKRAITSFNRRFMELDEDTEALATEVNLLR